MRPRPNSAKTSSEKIVTVARTVGEAPTEGPLLGYLEAIFTDLYQL